jgi:NADPH:quinone reductase-like Zn-dependent oxidoreductase
MIKAVVVDPNAPGRLALGEVAEPTPAPSEAVVRVAAVSLNLGEIRNAQRAPAGARIGWDLAGTVERAAADGTGPREGARVVGMLGTGAWAEAVAVPTHALAELPMEVSFAQAATLPIAGLTALLVLERTTGLLGRRVLITGASGGVGVFACRLARLSGAHVVGLIRQARYEALVREAGAHEVVVGEDATGAAEHGPYRLIAESVGGRVLSQSLEMLGPDGVCVSFGTSSGADVAFNIWSLNRTVRGTLYGFLIFNELGHEPASVGLARLATLVAEERLRPHIDVEAPWTDVGSVTQQLLDRKIAGKAVLRIAQ